MKVAAIGAFGSIAFTIGTYGIGAVLPLLKLIGTFYLTLVFFVLVVLGIISRLPGFSILRFPSYIREEILIVHGGSGAVELLSKRSYVYAVYSYDKLTANPSGSTYGVGMQHTF